MSYTYTNQRELRAAFREYAAEVGLTVRRYRNHAAGELMHRTDTRVAFCEWLDALERNGDISPALADRATLD